MAKFSDSEYSPNELDKADIEEYIEKYGRAAVEKML